LSFLISHQNLTHYCPTITGLAIFLGFGSRYTFYEYEKKPEFTYTIKKARTMIEAYYERLLHGANATGAIFALKQFGWKGKAGFEHSERMQFNMMPSVRVEG
jgi:hypothetical protein